MRPQNMTGFLVLVLLALQLSGCTITTPEQIQPVPARTYHVMGDPREILGGSTLNRKSPLNIQEIEAWQNAALAAITHFTDGEFASPPVQDQIEIERENMTAGHPDREVGLSNQGVNFFEMANGNWRMDLPNGWKIEMKLLPSGELEPSSLIFKDREVGVEFLHGSLSEDGQVMSFLISVETSNQKFVSAIYIEKLKSLTGTIVQQSLVAAGSVYEYLLGTGIAIPWRGPEIGIELCGDSKLSGPLTAAVSKWQSALEGRLQFNFSVVSEYPPFSDLQRRCFYPVNSYVRETRSNVFQFGMVTAFVSIDLNEIRDADVFLFNKDFDKYAQSLAEAGKTPEEAKLRLSNSLEFTLVHELGHFLGLGHQFNGTESVMSYSFSDLKPSPHDIEALHQLYPLRPAQ